MSVQQERAIRAVRALALLTASTVRRLLREGMVLRSMVWPGVVVISTLTLTISVLAATRASPNVAVPPNHAELAAELEAGGFAVHVVEDPRQAVLERTYPIGTDGDTLWARGTNTTATDLESILRERKHAPWIPKAPSEMPGIEAGEQMGLMISRLLALLFVMYGTVFGLGSVARDRDDGSLEAELSLPIPRWVGGLARWLASVGVLAVFYALCVWMLAAVIGVYDTLATIRHGIAACGGGVAIGLMVVGAAGLKQGFSGPLAAALTGVVGLAVLGAAFNLTFVPVASVFVGGSGWTSLLASLGLGGLCAVVYAARTGRA